MPYNVSLRDLYNNCLVDRGLRAEAGESLRLHALAWVEALNVRETWRLVQRWFDMMESGEAVSRYPDPFWDDERMDGRPAPTLETAEVVITELDADIMTEVNRLRNTDPDLQGSDFKRLPPHAKISFVQELYRTMKTERELVAEADRRLADGEAIPPPEGDPRWQER